MVFYTITTLFLKFYVPSISAHILDWHIYY